MKKLLLHICCANCGTIPIERLKHKFDITLFWYNPNITSKIEHEKRFKDVEKLVTIYSKNDIRQKSDNSFLIKGKYEPEKWFKAIKGLEKEPEGGKRCEICIKMRMEKSAKYAKQTGFSCIGTSLTTGPQKNAKKINAIAQKAADDNGLDFYVADFKKKDGFKKSIELSKKYKFYRQNFCGCGFSKK